jgi:hypothetical protein
MMILKTLPKTSIELSYLLYPLSLCTSIHITLSAQTPSSDLIVDLLVSIPRRISVSLDLRLDHKLLYNVFAQTQDYGLTYDEVSLYCHPYKLKEFKYVPIKGIHGGLSFYDYTLKLSQIEDLLISAASLFFQNTTIDINQSVVEKANFKRVKALVFDSCTVIGGINRLPSFFQLEKLMIWDT